MKNRLLKFFFLLAAVALFGPARAGTVTYVYTDPQGTPLAEADSNGAITATFDYRPYGAQVLGTPKDGPGYTGHVNDTDSGLVYMQARYYDVEGRFLSTDPATPTPGDVYGFNRYTYASNNPIANIDPDGRQDYSAQYLAAYRDCASTSGCNPQNIPSQIAKADASAVSMLVGMVPVASDAQNVVNAAHDPTPLNIVVAVVGAAPEAGGAIAKVVKEVGDAAEAAGTAAKIEKVGVAATQGPRYARGELRQQVLNKGRQADGTVKCAYCNKPTASQADHVVPYSKGGSTTIDNLEPACPSCNASKGAKNLGDEWIPPKDRE